MKMKSLIQFDCGFRLEILADDTAIVEIESVEALQHIRHKQRQTCLRITNKKLGSFINVDSIRHDRSAMVRIVNSL
jgi:GxxExxY protein